MHTLLASRKAHVNAVMKSMHQNYCSFPNPGHLRRAGLKYVGALGYTQLWGPTLFHILSSYHRLRTLSFWDVVPGKF